MQQLRKGGPVDVRKTLYLINRGRRLEFKIQEYEIIDKGL